MAVGIEAYSSAFPLTSNEILGMRGLPHLTQLLYVLLRSKMDKSTGVVGAKVGARISLRGLTEILYVEPGPGLKNTGSPSIKQIRNALQALQRHDLIKQRSIANLKNKQLIVFLPKAMRQDDCVQNKVDSDRGDQQGTPHSFAKTTGKAYKTATFQHFSKSSSSDVGNDPWSKVGTPHKDIYNTLSIQRGGQKIPEKFQPSAQCLGKIRANNLQGFHTPLELEKFISHSLSHDLRCSDWDSKYVCWLINAKQYQQRQGVNRGHSATPYRQSKQGLSAVDRVRQRNQLVSAKPIIDVGEDHSA